MNSRTSLHSPRPTSRLATLAWSLLAISLLAALLLVRQAEAASFAEPLQTPAISFAEAEELEAEEDWEDEEGEEDESEDEGEEEDQGDGTAGPLLLPPECLLHTADARVTASAAQGVVQLTIHYTSYTPTSVSVNYWLKGSKGSLQLGEAKHHFARNGTLHEEAHLSDHAIGKVLAARTFIVELDIPAAPSSCAKYSTQRLSAKHVAGGHATWSRPA